MSLAQGTHFFIAGGVSVNDVHGHDRFPFNFIWPTCWRAVAYWKAGVDAKGLRVLIYAPSYEIRVRDQEKEHPLVHMTYLPDNCPPHDWKTGAYWSHVRGKHKRKNPNHFLDEAYMILKAEGLDLKPIPIRSADDLTNELNKEARIGSVQYFGHSRAGAMFLEYSVDGRGLGTVQWRGTEASHVQPAQFSPGAVFSTFGCYQGDPAGLALELRNLWAIATTGSVTFTHYKAIGQKKPFPTSEKRQYVYYPAPLASQEFSSVPDTVNVTDKFEATEQFGLPDLDVIKENEVSGSIPGR
jgi:hypothetical protein